MRIVHFLSGLDRGGAQRVVVELSRQMVQKHEVEVWLKCKKEISFQLPSGIVVYELSTRGCVTGIKLIWSLYKLLRERKPDLLAAHTNRNTAPAIVAARLSGTPVYAVEHTVAEALRPPLWRMYRRVTYPFANRVIVLSSDQKRKFPFAATEVMPNPLPASIVEKARSTSAGTRHLDQSGRIRLLYVGRLERIKGVDRLIDVCSELSVPFYFDIVGSGSEEEALRRQSDRCGISHAVSFHGWQAELTIFYSRASAICVGSRLEGFGVSVVEGMAFGCVPLAYDVPGGLKEIISNGVSGYLVPEGNQREFASRIEQLYSEPEEFNRLSHAAQKRSERFLPEHIVKEWYQMFSLERRQKAESRR